jgi:hypothetical protein
MNKTDIQIHFDKCIKPLWDKKEFIFYGVSFQPWYDRNIYINQNVLIHLRVHKNGAATVESIRDAFRAYIGKFMVSGESITCYLNCYNSRIAIWTGFDSNKPIVESGYKNAELIEAVQVFIDNCRKP